MYDRPFFITEPVSNNAFHFEERKAHYGFPPRIFVPALREGSLGDLKISNEIVFEDYDDEGTLKSCNGLQTFIKTSLPNASVYIFDNHNHAFSFWQLEKIKGHIKNGVTLVHIDAHKDMRTPSVFLAPQEAQDEEMIFLYTNMVLNVGNFIPAAQKTDLVKDIIFIDSERSLEEFNLEKIRGRDIILDVDLDFFAPELDYINNQKKVEIIQKLMPLARAVTFATSPFFIQQELAISWLNEIWRSR